MLKAPVKETDSQEGTHRASQVVLVVKNTPANAGDVRNMGLISGLGKFPGESMATHSSILAWRNPWTEAGYSPQGCKESDITEAT